MTNQKSTFGGRHRSEWGKRPEAWCLHLVERWRRPSGGHRYGILATASMVHWASTCTIPGYASGRTLWSLAAGQACMGQYQCSADKAEQCWCLSFWEIWRRPEATSFRIWKDEWMQQPCLPRWWSGGQDCAPVVWTKSLQWCGFYEVGVWRTIFPARQRLVGSQCWGSIASRPALAHKVEWTKGGHTFSIETDDLVFIFRRCDESDLISFANEAIGYL